MDGFAIFLLVFLAIVVVPMFMYAAVSSYLSEKKEVKIREEEKHQENKHQEDKRIQEEKERDKKRRLENYIFCYVIGPNAFCSSVEKVLTELKENAPMRYREAVLYLPKAEYVPYRTGFSGRSDGLFTLDGSGSHTWQLNTYERFRSVFLHEVGHNVSYKFNDRSEESANTYRDVVLRELGY